MLNHYLNKHKETSKRFLNFTVPRVVAVSPQMRLVEDNPSSITLLDVYRQRCVKRNVEHDMPIAKYYERLATVQARGNQVLVSFNSFELLHPFVSLTDGYFNSDMG